MPIKMTYVLCNKIVHEYGVTLQERRLSVSMELRHGSVKIVGVSGFTLQERRLLVCQKMPIGIEIRNTDYVFLTIYHNGYITYYINNQYDIKAKC